jgi:hypothetical protein
MRKYDINSIIKNTPAFCAVFQMKHDLEVAEFKLKKYDILFATGFENTYRLLSKKGPIVVVHGSHVVFVAYEKVNG